MRLWSPLPRRGCRAGCFEWPLAPSRAPQRSQPNQRRSRSRAANSKAAAGRRGAALTPLPPPTRHTHDAHRATHARGEHHTPHAPTRACMQSAALMPHSEPASFVASASTGPSSTLADPYSFTPGLASTASERDTVAQRMHTAAGASETSEATGTTSAGAPLPLHMLYGVGGGGPSSHDSPALPSSTQHPMAAGFRRPSLADVKEFSLGDQPQSHMQHGHHHRTPSGRSRRGSHGEVSKRRRGDFRPHSLTSTYAKHSALLLDLCHACAGPSSARVHVHHATELVSDTRVTR